MSTVRAFCNNKRMSTGRVMNDGSFFQAYPTHRVFPNEVEWMHHWKMSSNDDFSFVSEGYEDMPPLETAAPPPAAAVSQQQRYGTMPPLEIVPTPTSKEKGTMTNTRTISQEERNSLVEMLHASVNNVVNEWCRRSGFDEPVSPPRAPAPSPTATTPPPKSTASSPPPLKRKASAKPRLEDWTYEKKYSFVAPPGTYYIGDICYFLLEPTYDGIYGGHGYSSGVYTQKSNGAFFMVDNTAHGDGEYRGTDGFGYGVDAGIIGIASRSLGPETDDKVYGGKLHTFKEPVEIKFQNGMFRFKSHSNYLAIDTVGDSYNSDEDW